MKIIYGLACLICFSILTEGAKASEYVYVDFLRSRGAVFIKSWKSIRDSGVVKQGLDYSCGAASMATILKEYYGLPVVESDILSVMNNEDMKASFYEMANALTKFGFRGVGYAVSYEQLSKLKMPVIVCLKYRNDDHFSVLRGVDEDSVWLADPSLGNRTYSKHQFLRMWESRNDKDLKGKILAIIPIRKDVQIVEDFFVHKPKRQTMPAISQQFFKNIK